VPGDTVDLGQVGRAGATARFSVEVYVVQPTDESNAEERAYATVARTQEFGELRRRYLAFAVPATITFMVWYVAYVICSNWARDFMNARVVGHVNVALIFGLLQFLSTFVIAFLYARHANKSLDRMAGELHDQYETERAAGEAR